MQVQTGVYSTGAQVFDWFHGNIKALTLSPGLSQLCCSKWGLASRVGPLATKADTKLESTWVSQSRRPSLYLEEGRCILDPLPGWNWYEPIYSVPLQHKSPYDYDPRIGQEAPYISSDLCKWPPVSVECRGSPQLDWHWTLWQSLLALIPRRCSNAPCFDIWDWKSSDRAISYLTKCSTPGSDQRYWSDGWSQGVLSSSGFQHRGPSTEFQI
jgi:hypothetical protein